MVKRIQDEEEKRKEENQLGLSDFDKKLQKLMDELDYLRKEQSIEQDRTVKTLEKIELENAKASENLLSLEKLNTRLDAAEKLNPNRMEEETAAMSYNFTKYLYDHPNN